MIINNLNNYFQELLEPIKCEKYTKAYITSIFTKYKNSNYDYSDKSLTLLYSEANNNRDIFMFQNIADWLFFTQVLYTEHLNNASEEYYNTLGQMSYYQCYRLTNRQLKIYEELADRFIVLYLEARKRINSSF